MCGVCAVAEGVISYRSLFHFEENMEVGYVVEGVCLVKLDEREDCM